jgi:hypothetical protein
MIKNYLKVSWRNIWKNKSFSYWVLLQVPCVVYIYYCMCGHSMGTINNLQTLKPCTGLDLLSK